MAPASRSKKRARGSSEDAPVNVKSISPITRDLALHADPPPKSINKLPMSNLKLSGHQKPVYTLSFSNSTKTSATGFMASGSFDKTILLWNVGQFCCDNYNTLTGHTNAILQLDWNKDDTMIFTASADKTCRAFDANLGGESIKKYTQAAIVNSVKASRSDVNLFATAGDDKCARIFDSRVARKSILSVDSEWQQTACELSSFGNVEGGLLYSGGIDNIMRAYDLRTLSDGACKPLFELEGHTDTISGCALSPDQTQLLTNAMDNTMRLWDVKSYVKGTRAVRSFVGHKHGSERRLLKCSWSHCGDLVSCGSSDKIVHVWDVETAEEVYSLPGHGASVNDVQFSKGGGVIASGSSDNSIFLGEI